MPEIISKHISMSSNKSGSRKIVGTNCRFDHCVPLGAATGRRTSSLTSCFSKVPVPDRRLEGLRGGRAVGAGRS